MPSPSTRSPSSTRGHDETTYRLDDNHNLVRKGGVSFHSNGADQLLTAGSTQLTYNAAGQATQAGQQALTFAYNGGPGNSMRWWTAANADQDLFVELIGFAETRTYVERIREHYARYAWLYRGEMP